MVIHQPREEKKMRTREKTRDINVGLSAYSWKLRQIFVHLRRTVFLKCKSDHVTDLLNLAMAPYFLQTKDQRFQYSRQGGPFVIWHPAIPSTSLLIPYHTKLLAVSEYAQLVYIFAHPVSTTLNVIPWPTLSSFFNSQFQEGPLL